MKKLLVSAVLLFSMQSVFADIVVYSAASTTNAVNDIAKALESEKHIKIKSSFASSSTLAKQIEAGAPAQLFISANPKWMDYLESRDLLAKGTRSDLLNNEVVLIAPENTSPQVKMDSDFDFAGSFSGKLCMGDPQHVPAGMYGKTALESLGWWDAVKSRVVAASDVRSALSFVERGECPLGIVYATDAAITDKVKIVATFPEKTHDPVIYPVALMKGQEANKEAKAVMEFLFSPEAESIFAKYGFKTVKH